MAPKKKLNRLTPTEAQLVQGALDGQNPNALLNYFLWNPQLSGSTFFSVPDKQINKLKIPEFVAYAQEKQSVYNKLAEIWGDIGRPEFFAYDGKDYLPIEPEEYATFDLHFKQYRVIRNIDDPAFHLSHGTILLPWQLDMYKNRSSTQVIVGGVGSAKTVGAILMILIEAAILQDYYALVLAPHSSQINFIHREMLKIVSGTPYGNKLMVHHTEKPKAIYIGHKDIGVNIIEFLSIEDRAEASQKILTLTIDRALIDQTEKFEELDEIIANVSGRQRGIAQGGRKRVGQTTLLANSGDNPVLWSWFDDGFEDEGEIWSYSPPTQLNPHLTVDDLLRYETNVGTDVQTISERIKGKRPLGSGEHFSKEDLEKVRSVKLDEMMDNNTRLGVPGWTLKKVRRADTVLWESPPISGHQYIVTADPGWANPPFRNSPALGVWDVTNFPDTPATMVAFAWVFGENSPKPWMEKFGHYISVYGAYGNAFYEGTGPQAGYQYMEDMQNIDAIPVQLGGPQTKYIYLNMLKGLVSNGRLAIPNIEHLFSQLARYKLPDGKLRQDIVSMLIVTASIIGPMVTMEVNNDVHDSETEIPTEGRYDRALDGAA